MTSKYKVFQKRAAKGVVLSALFVKKPLTATVIHALSKPKAIFLILAAFAGIAFIFALFQLASRDPLITIIISGTIVVSSLLLFFVRIRFRLLLLTLIFISVVFGFYKYLSDESLKKQVDGVITEGLDQGKSTYDSLAN